MKVLLEPVLWIALVAWAALIYWAIAYIGAANSIAEWIDANDRDLWLRLSWTNWGRQMSRYTNLTARRLESLVLLRNAAGLSSDAEFLARLSDARWAAFFCFFFWTAAIVATGLLFNHLGI